MIEEENLGDELFFKEIDSVYRGRAGIVSRLEEFEVKDSVSMINDMVRGIVRGKLP